MIDYLETKGLEVDEPFVILCAMEGEKQVDMKTRKYALINGEPFINLGRYSFNSQCGREMRKVKNLSKGN